MVLTKKDRAHLDKAVPIATYLSNGQHRFSDLLLDYLLYPKPGIIGSASMYATPGAALNVNITGGFVRDAAGAVIEVIPQTNYGTFTAPASTLSKYYLITYNPVTKAYVTTAGTAAVTGTEVVPATPAGQIPVATVDVANGDTTLTQAKINNAVRLLR